MLPVTAAQAMGVAVAHLPGLSTCRRADPHPGKSTTDARDAFIIANAALTVSYTLGKLDVPSEAQAELAMLLGRLSAGDERELLGAAV